MKLPSWRAGAGFLLVLVAAVTFIGFGAVSRGDAPDDQADVAGTDPASGAGDPSDDGMTARTPSDATVAGAAGTAIPHGLPPVDPVDPPAFATGLPDDVLFLPDPEARGLFAGRFPFGEDDREYIEFNRAALATLGVGSELSMRAPDTGAEHLLRVYEVQVHPNGDKSWLARVVDGSGEVLPAVFTQGVDSTLGSITTGGGTYSLEAEGRLGWIANVDDLRRHQDFSIPDVMEPGPGEGRVPVPGGR